jgi:RNA polymerase sigma-70 factor (ECF subfamily)
MQPSPVVSLNRAVAAAKVRGAQAALAMIEPLAAKLDGYFYFHGARGAFLLELGRAEEARVAFNRAIALANTPAEAAHIRQQLDRLACPSPQTGR